MLAARVPGRGVAWTVVLPAISTWPRRRVLPVLAIPMPYRHLGATRLSPMVVYVAHVLVPCELPRRRA